MALRPGDQLGRYRILGPLGTGGMGVVFRTRDTELDREVAIKVLPEPVASDPQACARFEREARSVASLSHPNVLTIHDFGRSGEVAYAVMELLEGESLRDRLRRGPLPWREAVEIAVAVARGLAAAHEQGIIHRDIKPANVFLTTSGQVKILDFGLARRDTAYLEKEDDGAITPPPTAAGVVLGTVGYMSPEQAMGHPLEAHTDLFSLGCVLYEMLTGLRPFHETTPPETMLAIVRKQPPPLAEAGCQVPAAVDRVLWQCLRKRPKERPESAAVLAALLERTLEMETDATTPVSAVQPGWRRRVGLGWAAVAAVGLVIAGAAAVHRLRAAGLSRPAAGQRIESLAVLPLAEIPPTAHTWFADGMTEAIIAELGRIQALRVISRTSVLRYRGTTRPIPEIGKELGVDTILEGSVTRSGNKVRVVVRLIEARADRPILSRTFETEQADVLALEHEIATAVASEIRVTLTSQERSRMADVPKVDPAAQEAYLKGQYSLSRAGATSTIRAIEHFNEAIRRDPGYALAHVALARAHIVLARATIRPSLEDFDAARAAATRALDLDPHQAEAHAILGIIAMEHDWSWGAAQEHFLRAAALSPGLALVHQGTAELLAAQGRFDQAIAHAQRALELDPLSADRRTAVAMICFLVRRFEEGAGHCRRALELDPRSTSSALGFLSLCLEQLGRYDEALDAGTRANTLLGVDPAECPEMGHLLAVSGRRDEALAMLARLRERGRRAYVPGTGLALVEVGLGQREAALASLDAAYAERDPWMLFVAVDPRFEPLHRDERFEQILRRMGLPIPSG